VIPLDLCAEFKDINDTLEFVCIFNQDTIQDLTFTMLKEHNDIVIPHMIFMVLAPLKNLKKLKIASISAIKKTNIELLNNAFGKES
jgi:hypothetical protein